MQHYIFADDLSQRTLVEKEVGEHIQVVERPVLGIYEGENETYIEASAENSGSILYDKEIRDKPRTRRTKRNV